MTESKLRVRPQALADYLCQRYRIQPGQALCVSLGQPQTGDNHRAVQAWVREVIEDYRDLDPNDQVRQIDSALCSLMIETGIIDDLTEGYEVSTNTVAHLFESRPRQPSVFLGRSLRPRPNGVTADNVIDFRRRTDRD